MLLMQKKYFDAIRAGRKTTTLRFWRSCRVRPQSRHRVPGLGTIRIEDVRTVDWDELTDADARSDGFPCLEALKQALHELYPAEARTGRNLYRIHFVLLWPGRQA